MIEFCSVSYQYPDGPTALNKVNVRIENGSVVAILGKNGAGKTTFVKCMNGLVKPTSGEVIIDGVSTRDASVAQMAKKVGLVFQNSDNQLFATSLKEELDFSLKNIGMAELKRGHVIDETLARMNLSSFKEKSPFLLSGGERKRAAFASLICMDQDVFIADEPTQGQDEIQRANIEHILHQMQARQKTVIIISHDLDFIARIADRLLVFDNGQILLDGRVEDVLGSPRALDIQQLPVTQELLLKWLLKEKNGASKRLFAMDQDTLISTIIVTIKARQDHVH